MNHLIAEQHGGATAPPTAFILSGTGNNYVSLSWNQPIFEGGFSSYQIYKDGALLTTISSISTLAYNDYGVSVGSGYNYYVKAIDLTGQSTNSNTIYLGVTENVNPSINYFGIAQTSTEITVSVSATDDSGIELIRIGYGSRIANSYNNGASPASMDYTWTKLSTEKGKRITIYTLVGDTVGNYSSGYAYSVLIT